MRGDDRPPTDLVDLIARIAVDLRLENLSYPTVLFQLQRIRTLLEMIDETGGLDDDLKRRFSDTMSHDEGIRLLDRN